MEPDLSKSQTSDNGPRNKPFCKRKYYLHWNKPCNMIKRSLPGLTVDSRLASFSNDHDQVWHVKFWFSFCIHLILPLSLGHSLTPFPLWMMPVHGGHHFHCALRNLGGLWPEGVQALFLTSFSNERWVLVQTYRVKPSLNISYQVGYLGEIMPKTTRLNSPSWLRYFHTWTLLSYRLPYEQLIEIGFDHNTWNDTNKSFRGSRCK
jgi:hypothetical protein